MLHYHLASLFGFYEIWRHSASESFSCGLSPLSHPRNLHDTLFPQCSDISCLISTSWKWKSLSHVWLFVTPWTIENSLGQNTGVGSLSLLQGIFPTQGLNPGLLHCRWILYQLSHKGSPRVLEWIAYPFSSGSSRPRNRTGVSCIAGGFFTNELSRKPWTMSSVQSFSRVWLFETPWIAACQASLSITNSWSLLKLMPIESVMPSNHLILCCPLLHPLSFPISGSFPVSQFFASGGQSNGASASASVLPMNIQGWFPLGLTGLISLKYSKESSPTP